MPSDYRKLSFWLDSLPHELQPRPALSGPLKTDIAIVGAGYTGLWTAWFLKQLRPELDITLLEAEIAGYGASGRNGGWCSGYHSGIDFWLNDPATREAGLQLQRLTFEAVHEVGRFAKEQSVDCHFEISGALEIAVNAAQLLRLRRELRELSGLGFGEADYEWLDRADLQGRLNVEGALAAVHMKHCAAVHPARLVRGLAMAVERAGARILERTRVQACKGNTLQTTHGEVQAETVLFATEGYSDSVRGRERGLIPVHSMMVVTKPLSVRQQAALGDGKRYCFGNLDHLVTYGQLTADRRLAFGCRGSYHFGSGLRQFDHSDPEFRLVESTLQRFFPDIGPLEFTHGWGGAMGVSRTLRPSVNFDAGRRQGWAGGFFGNGVGCALLAGRTLADLALGRDTERARMPWVNSADARRRWEKEPLRWIGIKSRAKLMRFADRADYRDQGRRAALYTKIINGLTP